MSERLSFLDKARETIKSSLKECESHYIILCRRKNDLDKFFPLTGASFLSLADEQIGFIDQFIYRFTKLQDSFGTRMLPSLFSFYENETMPVPFLDKLSRLEKLEVLTSEDDWLFFRELRNNLTHDYPESTEQTVRTLNILYDSWNKLGDLYLTVKKHAEKVKNK